MRSGGGYTGVVPPDPIPNSVVKYSWADDSSSSAKVRRRHQSAFFYLILIQKKINRFPKLHLFAIMSEHIYRL